MPVVANDIKIRYSTKNGSAGNSLASNAADSLGKYMSTTDIADNIVGNLFRYIEPTESENGITIYRCFFIYNSNAGAYLNNATFDITGSNAAGGTVSFGKDPVGPIAYNSAAAQAASIANELAAPAGVTFTTAQIALGNLAANQCIAMWGRLVVPAGSGPVGGDYVTFQLNGETV